MARCGRFLGIAGVLTPGIVFLCSCSGHQSFSTAPAAGEYLPQTYASLKGAAAATLRVTDLDGGAEATGTQTGALPIVNGSRLRIALSGGNIVSANVDAGDSSEALEPAGEGRWTAIVRYVDSSNPPVTDPVLQVTMRTKTGQRTFRIPVEELHQ
jgi:hypothetical protein